MIRLNAFVNLIKQLPSLKMDDSDDEEYFWYSEPEIEEDEVWNPEGGEWSQSIHSDSNTNPRVQTGNGDEFSQFANWHYGMPPPRLNPPPRPSIPHSNERDYAELRRRKFLCLHYFSNMLGFSFDDTNEDVYPLDSIKEWNDIKEFTTWGDMLKEHIGNGKA